MLMQYARTIAVVGALVIATALSAGSALARDFAITIARTSENSNSVTGELYVNGTFLSHTLELPYKNNKSLISSIPSGTYKSFLRYDKSDKWRIQLIDVPGRTGIQLHVGNYPSQIEGCVLVGNAVYNRENRVSGSVEAYRRLRESFYGASDPVSTPDKEITVTIQYNRGQTHFNSNAPDPFFNRVSIRYKGNGNWDFYRTDQGKVQSELVEKLRDLNFIYVSASGGESAIPIFGGRMKIKNKQGEFRDSLQDAHILARQN